MENSCEELKKYKEAVDFLAEHEVGSLILNSGNDHAKVIFQAIFTNSRNHIKILAGNLHNEVTNSEEYINALIGFLQLNGSKLDILLERRPQEHEKSILFERLYNYKDKIRIKSTDNKYYVSRKNENGDIQKDYIHFCIGDKRMYRLETDTKQRSARCNFNDKEFVTVLDDIFCVELERGNAIDWSELALNYENY